MINDERGVYFTGASCILVATTVNYYLTQAFSVLVWLKVDTGTGEATIFSRSNQTNIDMLIFKYNMDTQILIFSLTGIEVQSQTVDLTTWSLISATYEEFPSINSSKLRIYSNEELNIQGWFELAYANVAGEP